MSMETGIQRIYKKRYDGLYQEYVVILIHYNDGAGNITTKHDKTIPGGLYKEAGLGERSVYGEVYFFDPEDERDKHLIMVKAD